MTFQDPTYQVTCILLCGTGVTQLCKASMSTVGCSQQEATLLSLARGRSWLEEWTSSQLWADFPSWLAVGHVRYWVLLLLFLFRYSYRALFENSGRIVRKSHKPGIGNVGGCHRNECWGLFCSEHSPFLWRRQPSMSRVIPTKTFWFYLELSWILVWAFPDCSLLVLGCSITNADCSICCVSRNPSDLQDKSKRYLLLWLWITEHAGGDVLHSNQVLYKKKSELSFLNF